MILIAESGSTKTHWCLLNTISSERKIIKTDGINPFYQDETAILKMLRQQFNDSQRRFKRIYFYGAGCANPQAINIVTGALSTFFAPTKIAVETDLLAAAHALCGHHKGIACILGTGSNSCLYDGNSIIQNVSPLGFILGDEGSGAVIGKKLISDILKHQLPKSISDLFFKKYPLTTTEILDHIYKQPFPNRFAAQFTYFIAEHIHQPPLAKIVTDAFSDFFERNILQYPNASLLPIHFTGSIAWHFRELLTNVAHNYHLQIATVLQDPLPGLIDYHLEK